MNMSNFFDRNLLYLLLLTVGLSVGGCDIFSSGGDGGSSFPETEEEIQQAAENTEDIRQKAQPVIDNEIDQASSSGESVNAPALAQEIEDFESVNSAKASSSGASISVEQEDGTSSNFILAQRNDGRFFERVESSSQVNSSGITEEEEKLQLAIKKGSKDGGEAVILAPFQSSFNAPLDRISELFESAGFSVDLFVNGNANLGKFRGDFLAQYDAIYIGTHGADGVSTRDGTTTATLLTGTEFSQGRQNSLSDDLRRAVVTSYAEGSTYYGISVPWLEQTLKNDDFTADSEDFSADWVFANACESTLTDSGQSSLVRAFLDNGAGGYTGWDIVVPNQLAISAGETLTSNVTSGRSLSTSTQNTITSGLNPIEWVAYLLGQDVSNVQEIDSNQRTSDSYYLFDPSRVVGVASVQPSSGPPGTEVTYDVEIQDAFLDQVNNVDLFIDNTNENISMEQISESVWRNEPELTAPPADSYPRVDTFIFTAYDTDGTELGEGSDTFTITEPEQSTSETKYARKWR